MSGDPEVYLFYAKSKNISSTSAASCVLSVGSHSPQWQGGCSAPGAAGPAPAASSSGFRGPGRSPAIWSAAASPSATHELVAQPPPPRRAPAAFIRALMAGVRVCYWLLPWHKLALPCSLRALCSSILCGDAPHTRISRPCCLARRLLVHSSMISLTHVRCHALWPFAAVICHVSGYAEGRLESRKIKSGRLPEFEERRTNWCICSGSL